MAIRFNRSKHLMWGYPFSEVVGFLVVHYQLLLIMPMVMAFFVEEHYISRVSIVSNTAGMFVAVAPHWSETRSWLMLSGFPIFHIYLLVGLIFAVIAFLGYTTGESQPLSSIGSVGSSSTASSRDSSALSWRWTSQVGKQFSIQEVLDPFPPAN